MLLLGYPLLVYVLRTTAARQLEESMFRQLNAEEVSKLELAQSPALLEIAARTGESVNFNITESSQGGVVQDGVSVSMDCSPWLSKVTNGTVQWYVYRYRDLDHTQLETRQPQTKEELDVSRTLHRIGGDFNQFYSITRVNIRQDGGVYECEVCSAGDTPSEVCRSANVTLAIAGRPPLLNFTTNDVSDERNEFFEDYRVGATICVDINDTDAVHNRPKRQVVLRCPVLSEDIENDVPPRIPPPKRTWTHTSLDGRTASLSTEIVGIAHDYTDEFLCNFPRLDPLSAMGAFFPNTNPADDSDSFIFDFFNMTTNDIQFAILSEAFGTWTCTVSNALGTENATTFIDECDADIVLLPSSVFPVCLMPTSTILESIVTSVEITLNSTAADTRSLFLSSPSFSLSLSISHTPTPTLSKAMERPGEATSVINDTHVPTSSLPIFTSSMSFALPISPNATSDFLTDTKSLDETTILLPPTSSPSQTFPSPSLMPPNATQPSLETTSSHTAAFTHASSQPIFTSSPPLMETGTPDAAATDFISTLTPVTLTASLSLPLSISPTPTPSLPKDREPFGNITSVINDTYVPTLTSSIPSPLPTSPTPTLDMLTDTESFDDASTLQATTSTPLHISPTSTVLFKPPDKPDSDSSTTHISIWLYVMLTMAALI